MKSTNPLIIRSASATTALAFFTLSLLTTSPARAQAVAQPKPAPTTTTTTMPATTPLTTTEKDIVELSPFTVTSQKDIGYFASNTLAGSRLNSNIGDLASPITVITKQQLEDTNSRDLNDVFLYEANTEGARNYTPIEVNRSSLKDRVGGSATNGIGANTAVTANRIRGMAPADMTWNYYASISRMRADTYNADSLEISRGPNSILAGLGSPSGILNQTIGTGRINSNSTVVDIAIDNNGSHRESLAITRTLIKDKLTFNVAALYDDREFSRKPSSDISRREMGGFTYKPFPKTTITGFVEGYTNTSRTPNEMTPRDGITPWLKGGRPVWNPLTRRVTFLDTNTTSAPYLTSDTQVIVFNGANVTLTGDTILTDRRSPRFVPGLGFGSYVRPTKFINPDGAFFWSQGQASVFNIYNLTAAQVSAVATADPVNFDIFQRRYSNSAVTPGPAAWDVVGTSIYVPAGISNKGLYNWNKINTTAANVGWMRNGTYNLEVEQQILPNLFFSAGWFRQDLDTLENYPIAQLTATTAAVDTNTHLPDGRVNPNYLRTFVDAQDPDTAETPELNETFRAMLAYDLDFTKHVGWRHWLGRHRLLGFASRVENQYTQIRERFAFSDPSDPRFLTPLTALGLQTARAAGYRYSGNSSTTRQIYYVGDNGTIGYGPATNARNPALGTTQSTSITAYNYASRQWEQATATTGVELYDAGNGYFRSQKLVNTLSFAAQSFWWNDRIVTTYGARRDKWAGRNSTTGIDANGSPTLTNAQLYPDWRLATNGLLTRWAKREYLEGTTGSLGVVVKPLKWLSLSANRSDNFNPPPNASTDIFGRALPKPTGKSKDYGFSFNLFDEKLIARVIFFDGISNAERTGTANTLLGRLQRQDNANLKGWAEMVVRIRSGQPSRPGQPGANNNWADLTANPLTQAQQDQVAAMMGGLPYNWPGSLSITSTQTNKAKGAEFELIYNPTHNWNIKFTAGKQETSYTNILPEYEEWYNYRLPLWKAAIATDMDALYTQPDGKQISLRNFWAGYGFGETNISTGVNGSNPEDWYAKVVAGEVAGARQLEGAAPFGQRKWRANVISNYEFVTGPLKNFAVGGAVRWEDRAIIGYRGAVNAVGQYLRTDPTRPVYDTDVGASAFNDLTHFDLWFSYRFKMWNDKVRTKVKLNVFDALQSGGIMPVYVNYDGVPVGYRIIDSRRFTLSAKFEF